MALPKLVAPVPGTILVTSTSPMSTPEFATNLPIAFVPAGKEGKEVTSTSPISTPELAVNLPIAAVPAPSITVPIEFVPAGRAGNEVTSTSPISTPEFAANLPIALEPAGSAPAIADTATVPVTVTVPILEMSTATSPVESVFMALILAPSYPATTKTELGNLSLWI